MTALIKLIKRRSLLVMAAVLSSGLCAAAALLWNSRLGTFIDLVSAGQFPPMRAVLSALAVLAFTGGAAWLKGMLSSFACESMAHDLRMGYVRRIAECCIPEIEALNAGEQMSGLQNEIADVSGYLNASLFQLFDDAVRFFTTILWLLLISPSLTLLSNLPVVPILFYVMWSGRIIQKAAGRSQEAKTGMNGYADTLLTLFPVIRLYGASKLMLCGYRKALTEWQDHTVSLERTKARLMSLSGLLSSIPLMLLMLFGGGRVIGGTITIGTLYIFLNLSGNVSGVMMNMPGYITSFRQFLANMERIGPKIVIE